MLGPVNQIENVEALNEMTDEAVLQLLDNAPHIETNKIEQARILGPDLMCKFSSTNEAEEEVAALDHALKLGLSVPIVRRVIESSTSIGTVIIMDYVHGRTLEQMWPELDLLDTIRYALQLRKFINIMHSSKSIQGGGVANGRFYCKWLDSITPPEPSLSPTRFTSYLNWWLSMHIPGRAGPEPTLSPLNTHTFVHQDLVPRNMIIDDDRRLWIVDWGYSGYYPEFFEYAQLKDPMFGKPIEGSRIFTETLWHWKWKLFCIVAVDFRIIRVSGLYKLLQRLAFRTRLLPAPIPHKDY